MSGFDYDVEALLDSVAQDQAAKAAKAEQNATQNELHERRSSNEEISGGLSQHHERGGSNAAADYIPLHSSADDKDMSPPPSRSERENVQPRRRSLSRESDRRFAGRDSFRRGGGDFYRGGRRRSRSRSPNDDRHYRPGGRRRSDDRDRIGYRGGRRDYRRRSPDRRRPRSRSPSPQLNDDERDRRTVFVQQLAARLRTKDLAAFFEKVGPVKEAQIVKDRVSGRSKGVGYVEFRNEESVAAAIQLTGQKLYDIPVIVQLTEAEKNRQARTGESTTSASGVPFHRLYVGNIHFSITEEDLTNVFEPFGELEFVQLQKEEGTGRSRGYGFVQYRDPACAKEALEKMNGFELANRAIRVGLGNDKFTNESTARLLNTFPNQQNYQGSAFSGAGGRGPLAGGSSNFDRIGGRDTDKNIGTASALDDSDVVGVNFSNYSRDALMRKLARTEEPTTRREDQERAIKAKADARAAALLANISQASRCVVLKNMFDPNEEEGEDWAKELEEDVKTECDAKYGKVNHIAIDPHSQGDIYIKFDKIEGGENAIKGLNGRFFGGRQITASFVVDAVYYSHFPRAKAL